MNITEQREKQTKFILQKMLEGKTITTLWGHTQYPPIADALRVARMLKTEYPAYIRKQRMETENSYYVGYFMDQHQIEAFKRK